MMKKGKLGNQGFTLLEVIISIAILGMITVPLMKYFTDSMRYSALMGQKQRATLLAQETIENIKSNDRVIQRLANASGGLYYWVPSMSGQDWDDATGSYSVVNRAGFDENAGTGTLVLSKKGLTEFDVIATISTELTDEDGTVLSNANTAVIPTIPGMLDDTKNVMIVERNEEEQAIMYFMGVNSTAKLMLNGMPSPSASPSASPLPGVTPSPSPAGFRVLASEDDVRDIWTREIFIDIKKTSATTPYTVSCYYQYTCENISFKSEEVFTTSDLQNTMVDEIESVYLLFNIVNPDEDVIHVDFQDSTGGTMPDLMLVCQNLDALAGTPGEAPAPSVSPDPSASPLPGSGSYTFTQDTYSLGVEVKNCANCVVRTNVTDKGTVSPSGAGATLDLKPLTSSSAYVRVITLGVEVYKKGDYAAGNDPLAKMMSTKGE